MDMMSVIAQAERAVRETMELEIVSLYTESHKSLSLIGKAYGMSRQAVWKILKKRGVDMKGGNQHVTATCRFCGKEYPTTMLRLKKDLGQFCHRNCWHDYLVKKSITKNLTS
jgi:predicted HTH domain antitoxin